MEINLREKLRTLRQSKNITQEVLANHLGITPQSVGKWERGEGFPDITLLPKIAFYFDITVDELLCVDQVKIEETIKEYQRQSEICKQNGENEKNLEIWETAYSAFPNDCRVIEELMYAINREEIYPCPMDKAKRIIALGEEVLQRSTDTRQREGAIQKLCYTYNSIGDKEKALYYADMGGNFYVTREGLRAVILEGEDGVKACQNYIMSAIGMVALTVSTMTRKFESDTTKEFVFSHEESIEAYQFAIDMLEQLFSDGNVGFYANDLSSYYYLIATEYAKMKDGKNTLKHLEESSKYAILEATLTDANYTAPMVNRLKHTKASTSKNYTGNACNVRIKALEDNIFDFVREEEQFEKILTNLIRYAAPPSPMGEGACNIADNI